LDGGVETSGVPAGSSGEVLGLLEVGLEGCCQLLLEGRVALELSVSHLEVILSLRSTSGQASSVVEALESLGVDGSSASKGDSRGETHDVDVTLDTERMWLNRNKKDHTKSQRKNVVKR
jgi:hypothetical protein